VVSLHAWLDLDPGLFQTAPKTGLEQFPFLFIEFPVSRMSIVASARPVISSVPTGRSLIYRAGTLDLFLLRVDEVQLEDAVLPTTDHARIEQ
jgi:hypothetical protein